MSNREDRQVSVEFFALPGSGKTTVWRALRHRHPGWGDGYALMPGHHFVRCFVGHPMQMMGAVAPYLPRLASPARRVVSWRARQRLASELAARRSLSPCVFQEGSAQEAWRVLQRDPKALPDRLLARLLPVADLSVVLEVPASVARMRLGARGRPPLPVEEPVDGDAWTRASQAFDRVVAALEGGSVVRIDATRPVEETVAAVESEVAAAGERAFDEG